MKKIVFLALATAVVVLIASLISCSSPNQSAETSDSGENTAIEEVKDSLTSDVKGNFEAVKYENGYVVNFDDMAYWYVEDGVVWSLNGFAKTYAEHTEYKYGIEWEDLF